MARLARRSAESAPEAFLLATCLRVEVAVPGPDGLLDDVLVRLLGAIPEGGRRTTGPDAVRHLFRVASGLESPILGEVEVLTQFRKALATTKASASTAGSFLKLLEQAVATGRAARRALPESPRGSLAAVAADAVAPFDRVAVLGSGDMAAATVSLLAALPEPPRVTVVARTPDHVRFGAEAVWGFDRAAEALSSFPAVVSATSAKGRLIPDETLVELLGSRREPLTLIDLAMPPDFRPPPDAPVEYVPIDVLASRVSAGGGAGEAETLAEAGAEAAWRRYSAGEDVARVIGRLMAEGDGVVERLVARFEGRLADEEDAVVLRQAVHTVARTLLAAPVERINHSADPGETAAMVASVFGIGDD